MKNIIIVILSMLFFSCSSSIEPDGDYRIKYNDKKVTVYNRNSGKIEFKITGNTYIEGNKWKGYLVDSAKLIRVSDTPQKKEIFSFYLLEKDTKLNISYEVVYKQDQVIEKEGLLGHVNGNMGFDKYSNISVEGNPDCAGYVHDVKSRFGLLIKKSRFGLLTYFGEWKSHLDKSTEEYDKSTLRKMGNTYKAAFKVINSTNAIQLLCQPDGYNSTFTFVNHADRQTIPRQNAIMYGSSNTNNPAYGVKGIVSRGLKGTWTVFAKSSESGDKRNEGLDNPDFMAACLKLKDEGIEIIPHTISYNPDFRKDLIEYLPCFEAFNVRNWVDHMLRTTNPSSGLHSQGNDPDSPNYVMDLLENIDYVWSYQDTYVYGDSASQINQLFDDRFAFPSYLLYQHDKIKRPVNGKVWQYKNTWTAFRYLISNHVNPQDFIDDLVDKCGVWTDHSYFAMRSRENIHWLLNGNDVVISDELDAYFSEIQSRVLKGEIWNPTMTEWLDYNVQLLNVEMKHKNSEIEIFNNNENPIHGCSFKINNYFNIPTLNGIPMNGKIVKGGVIVWGNLPIGKSTINLM